MTSRILVSLRVATSPERAFAVFTGEIAIWWRPEGLFQFTPSVTGVLAFEPGVAEPPLLLGCAPALKTSHSARSLESVECPPKSGPDLLREFGAFCPSKGGQNEP